MPPASAGSSGAALRSNLLALLEPVVVGAGYDFEDIAVTRAGRRSVVRVVVDAEGGIDLDAVAEVSRVVSDALDDALATDGALAGALAGSYTLEVTSPGVDRPLTQERHWRRAAGRLVEVETDGEPVTGRVVSTSGEGVTLDVHGTPRTLQWSVLGRGKVQVEFNRPDGKGK